MIPRDQLGRSLTVCVEVVWNRCIYDKVKIESIGDKHKNGRNLNWNKDISKSKNMYL